VDHNVERCRGLYARIELSLSRPEVVASKAQPSYINRNALADRDRDLHVGCNSEQDEIG